MKERRKNIAASVKAQLKNLCKDGELFNYKLHNYVVERFLYRLSRSKYNRQFVLKGGVMLRLWDKKEYRHTKDVDFLSFGDNSVEKIIAEFKEICELGVAEDGLRFDSASVTGQRIKAGQKYEGVRINLFCYLGKAKIPLQFDIGFGDVVVPEMERKKVPLLLKNDSFEVNVYPMETFIAEKYETVISLGIPNSRMKDYYDIWYLAVNHSFEASRLKNTLIAVFQRRDTIIPVDLPETLSDYFFNNPGKQKQWTAFLNRINESSTISLKDVTGTIERFLFDLMKNDLSGVWEPGKGWVNPN